MNNYPPIVKKGKMIKEKGHKILCPYCSSSDIDDRGTVNTLVAGPPGINHTWTDCYCNDCDQLFCKEAKGGEVWYTTNRGRRAKVLAGVPNCFEAYILDCSYCEDGEVKRVHRNRADTEDAIVLAYKDGKYQYRRFFECTKCGAREELPL